MYCSSRIIYCNGTECGQGKYYRAGKYICSHNNLEALYPQIAEEWDPINAIRPDQYLPEASFKAKWICQLNWCGCHRWETTISKRTQRGDGCPYCSNRKLCPHNNLKARYPELCEEWDPNNLKSPEEYPPVSGKEVDWVCKSDRNCGCHKWPAIISSRTSGCGGCPFCTGQKLCIHNNLTTTHPELCLDWDPANSLTPDKYSFGSNKEVDWICRSEKNCGCHKWRASISHRTRLGIHGRNCPYCCNQRVCIHSNLKAKHPKLCEEWDPENLHGPEQYPPGSDARVKWICRLNPLHKWRTNIYDRARGTGCPHCSPTPGYSKVAIKWLDLIMSIEHINIQYALSSEGEVKIPGIGKVDGYCHETNTVYEFHGDFWHGNPLIFDSNDINQVNHKTFGELYQKTIERENKIRSLGYNLVVHWETEQTYEITLPFQELTTIFNNTSSNIEII